MRGKEEGTWDIPKGEGHTCKGEEGVDTLLPTSQSSVNTSGGKEEGTWDIPKGEGHTCKGEEGVDTLLPTLSEFCEYIRR